MSERVLWTANDDEVTTAYEVESGPAEAGPFTLIATIPHNKANLAVYLPATDQFFFDDLVGTPATFYRVRATDGAAFSAYTLVRQPEPDPSPICLVHGRILGADARPAVGLQVHANIVLSEKDKSGQFLGELGVSSTDIDAFTDADGDWELALLQGAEVEITIPPTNLVKVFTVPAAATAELTDLI